MVQGAGPAGAGLREGPEGHHHRPAGVRPSRPVRPGGDRPLTDPAGRPAPRRERWPRVVLKLSGEAFANPATGYGIDGTIVARIAAEVAEVRHDLGTEIAIVVGGGNIW